MNTTPLKEQVVGTVRPALGILAGAVILLFLLAASDVANLTLVRGLARSRELGVRAAMGAGSGRTRFWYLMSESVLIATAGALLGLVMARVAVRILIATSPGDIPRLDEVVVDDRAALVAVVSALVAVVLCGLMPLLTLKPTRLIATLKTASRSTGTLGGLRLRSGIVVGQLAISMILIVGAGLLCS